MEWNNTFPIDLVRNKNPFSAKNDVSIEYLQPQSIRIQINIRIYNIAKIMCKKYTKSRRFEIFFSKTENQNCINLGHQRIKVENPLPRMWIIEYAIQYSIHHYNNYTILIWLNLTRYFNKINLPVCIE